VIGRKESIFKKVEELQTSFSNSTEREMNIKKQSREFEQDRKLSLFSFIENII